MGWEASHKAINTHDKPHWCSNGKHSSESQGHFVFIQLKRFYATLLGGFASLSLFQIINKIVYQLTNISQQQIV